MTTAAGAKVPEDRAGRDEILSQVAISIVLNEDPVAAETAIRDLAGQADSADWARWASMAILLMQERVAEALPLLEQARGDAPQPSAEWDLRSEAGWQRVGRGSIVIAGGGPRFIGLAGEALHLTRSIAATNTNGTLVEFVARRVSGTDGDCRLEISDGSVREAVYVDAGFVRLLNGNGSLPLNTFRPHHYALWVTGQRSTLFVDGQPALEAAGLVADHSRQLGFGIFPIGSGADAESQWWQLRVIAGTTAPAQVPLMPRVWPARVWAEIVRSALATGRLTEALAASIRGRIAHPDDTEIASALLKAFDAVAQRDDLVTPFQRALGQLRLGDRALVVGRTARPTEPVVVAEKVGISFARIAGDRSIRALARRVLSGQRSARDVRFWALRDVSFELRAGEMLGIIGRNGAGKTTMLRLIADLIEPDEGQLRVSGKRILLSLGGSFLHDLTGRENVHLAGLYLGMTRREIDAQFDEIVEFAELWDAIDRPFRTYSTGMMSRLQFALATTVSPEILMLDELLGAGDASFVEKAETRMNRLLRRAKAVIVVTHNLEFVQRTCTQAILLEHGEMVFRGSPERAVARYRELLAQSPKRAER